MAMIDAFRFLALVRQDASFREKACSHGNTGGFRQFIAETGLCFDDDEIEEGIEINELRCTDESQVREIRQLGSWYRVMTGA
jgi:hypothetical protein